MKKRNKITISFLPYEDDLWQFVQDKKKEGNISEYVRNLIRNDKKNNPSKLDEERIVEKLLKALQDNDSVVGIKKSESIKDMLASDDVKDAIKNLF